MSTQRGWDIINSLNFDAKPNQGVEIGVTRFNDWLIVGPKRLIRGGSQKKLIHLYPCECQCDVRGKCGHRQELNYQNLKAGKSKRCRDCSNEHNRQSQLKRSA